MSSGFATAAHIRLEPGNGTPLYRQLYDGLRASILSGRLRPGARLPATRALARELSLSRHSVVNAYAQLHAEGYVDGAVGSGTYVARTLPDGCLLASPLPLREGGLGPPPVPVLPPATPLLSRRGRVLAETPVSVAGELRAVRPFRTGLPAVDRFPFGLWARLAARHWRAPAPARLGYGDPAGYRPLREAIAAYLGAARAVHCTADQVIVVAGSQQALSLAAHLLLDAGDTAWIEDPGYPGARGALLAAGVRPAPVPVDADGLDVAAGKRLAPDARLAYVTPSHQAPLGMTMSLPRRLALLEWAARQGAWVLEDDYDSEYRYVGRPLAALQGLDTAGRVLYLGTFSKVRLPALRLGYLVVPPALAGAVVNARALVDRHSPTVDQAALTDFIAEGHFARHIRRMRNLYAERQACLLDAARRDLTGLLDLQPSAAGMHLIGWLPDGVDDRAAARAAARHGVEALPLSAHVLAHLRPGGLLLGYAAFDAPASRDGVRRLAAALHDLIRRATPPAAATRRLEPAGAAAARRADD